MKRILSALIFLGCMIFPATVYAQSSGSTPPPPPYCTSANAGALYTNTSTSPATVYTCSYYNLEWQWVVNPSYGGLVYYSTPPRTCSGALPVFLAGWPNTLEYVCISGVPTAVGQGTFSALTGDVTSTATGGATTVKGIAGVPFCTGFSPTNGQALQYTIASSPNPCYTTATSSGGGASYQYVYLPNCSGTGTVLNSWAKYGPGLSVNDQCITVASTADATAGAGAVSLVGIVQAGAGTTGFAQVGVSGVLNCQFDSSAPSQGDYSSLSSAVGGECSAVAHTPANENPNTNIFYGTVDTTASAGAVTTVDVSQIPNTYAVQNGWIGPPYLTLLAAASYGGGYAVPSILQQTKPTAASGAAIVAGGDFWWPYVNTGFYSVTGPSSLGVSGHDFILLDSLSNADPYATPMGRINASWYVVPDVASQNGEIQTARSGNYWAFGASNLHIWTLTGNATLGPLINDNAGDTQIFDIVQAASGGPYTFTWPVAFTNPPAISTVASSSTIAAFLFDGTNYNCVWGCPSSGGGGTVNSAAANQLAYYASTGTAVSGTNALPAGTTAATQTAGDNTTKVATTAYVASPGAIAPTSVTAGIYAMPAEYSNGTCITSKTIAPANGNIQNVTLTNGDTCALTFTQPGSGTFFITLKVIQSAVSSYNGTISGCKWPGGTVPTITATTGAVDFVNVYLDGTHAYCEATQNFQ